ncbi:hypothetical protein CS0771_41350 [Catellatospora sp. IY07-71]|uniref:hypothetical protein n=1 Tax=Catellatospora sp. IY07-71 TaxID=2728827 RepID=UPI001BB33F99|nr:hypothetical protein [Catellatospora sp. IY07-71]BCJ74591.1 hypothetical protein CS0771_41350 [Catellatospora sp. IY07-71]
MSGSPKYSTAQSSRERAERAERERAERQRRREQELARLRAEAEARAKAERDARRRQAALAVDGLQARLTVLENDAAAARVHLSGGSDTQRLLVRLRADLAADRLDRIGAEAAGAQRALDTAETTLDEQIDRIVARRELVRALAASMPSTGYVIDLSSLDEDQAGTISLRARALDGDVLAVVVQDEDGGGGHRMVYSNAEMLHQSDAGVVEGGTCTDLVEVITVLNRSVEQAGFEAGGVRWDDGGHVRPDERRAEQRPAPAQHTQERPA